MKKKIPRIYIKEILYPDKIFCLSKEYIHYIKDVLRMKNQEILEIFNNTNYVFLAEIIYISKNKIKLQIFQHKLKNIESPLHIHLGQVISKKEKMDFTIQKSIEMGVNIITPLFSENCNVQEKLITLIKKIKRWEKIAISACQQCNRNILPTINNPKNIFLWCEKNKKNNIKIIFHPKSELTINDLSTPIKSIRIIIGSEKGFSNYEVQKIIKYGFIPIRLGPRILRTETAAIAAITALQMKFGDLNM